MSEIKDLYESRFLKSPLTFKESSVEDAQDREDGLADGFTIPLDAQARALSNKVKLPLAKRLVALFSMAGVPGRYLNAEDSEGTILAATDMLRKRATIRKAFLEFYEKLANAKGYAVPVVGESVSRRRHNIKESEFGDGIVAKRGQFLNKLFATVLIELGLPEALVGVTAPTAVQTGLLQTADLIDQDSSLDRALRTLALRMGIKMDDVQAGVHESRKVSEAVEVGQDEFTNEIVTLVTSLGIPEDILNLRRPQLVKALRQRKRTLRNRASIQMMMGRLNRLLADNTSQNAQDDEEEK